MQHIFLNKDTFKGAFLSRLEQRFHIDLEDSTVYQRYTILAELLDQHFDKKQQKTDQYIAEHEMKKAIYFSMEFLMGRLITNNLMNSGHFDVVKAAFDDLHIDLHEVEQSETDAGLGNGGLGRLGACFLDSAASLGLPLYGNSLRYQRGFFKQEIKDHKQVERPDPWLEEPFIWETKKPDEAIDIPFFGYVEHTRLINPVWIKAVPYDVKIIGDGNHIVNTLRLWSTEPSTRHQHHDEDYFHMVRAISDVLYPDDSKEKGKTLRLQQQYLFSAAGVKSAFNAFKATGKEWQDFPDAFVFQLNDTHPTLVIPEMMRILLDEEHLGYDEAWEITTRTCAFTNHTILSEALEKWNIGIFRNLLPRIYEILLEMNRRFRHMLEADGRFNKEQIYLMGLIGQHHIRMAHISIYGSFSVNGVAELHTHILKTIEMKDFHTLYPKKFNNKTNGITHRRWLFHTNKELCELLDQTIGADWRKDLTKLEAFAAFADDPKIQNAVYQVKEAKKQALAEKIYHEQGVKLDINSMFDIQVKRLHEYKRQLMNILHIIYVYRRLKQDAEFRKHYVPHSFIFGAKAAPSYHMAKAIIELIDTAAAIINQDVETKSLLKIVFVRNYNVSYAEYIMPAADLSEQISTASKEASGTGNMKFMMNGAITIGTMDGANVEIVREAGMDNAFIFGLSAEEVTAFYRNNGYRPQEIFDHDMRLQDVFAFIRMMHPNPLHFDYILNALLNSDYFLVMQDFNAYVEAHQAANEAYKDTSGWRRKMIINIAKSGFFTSDRTMNQYNKDIWKLNPIKF